MIFHIFARNLSYITYITNPNRILVTDFDLD